jgi:hypothetical protein
VCDRNGARAAAFTTRSDALRAELTTHYVAVLETARKLPTLKTLGEIARALGVFPGELLAPTPGPATLGSSW